MNDHEPVIRFENVSKRFVFTQDKPQSVLEMLISAFSRQGMRREQDLWAVQDVSFDVMPGRCLGIIGRNGGGKSTILKLVARILRPSSGRVVVRGRVSALLELGAGFHPDLTGQENIFLNAAVLGLSEAETKACYDDIVAFSELDEFINMPVKHYSSGMYMRLGFSVAIHVKPDILIVDEILAVGDQPFQTKCIDQIMEMKRQGITIILVSHNLTMIRALCSHLLWIEHGKVQSAGPVDEVAGQYMEYTYEQEGRRSTSANGFHAFERWGSGDVEITTLCFLDEDGNECQTFKTGCHMTVEIGYIAHKPVLEPEFGLAIHRQDGIHVTGPNSRLAGVEMGTVQGSGVIRYRIDRLPLLPARYRVTAAVHDSRLSHTYDYHKEAYSFRVVAGITNETHGLIEIPARWEWEPRERDEVLGEPLLKKGFA